MSYATQTFVVCDGCGERMPWANDSTPAAWSKVLMPAGEPYESRVVHWCGACGQLAFDAVRRREVTP